MIRGKSTVIGSGAGIRGGEGAPIRVLIWGVAVIAAMVLHAANVLLGDLNQDEGWYLYAARMVWEGSLPYVNFASTQGPVMAFGYAAAWPLVKIWGVTGGRVFTAALGMGVSFCAAWLAWRVVAGSEGAGRRFWAASASFFAFALAGVNVFQSYFSSIVKTYALAGLLLTAGFVVLTFAAGRRGSLALFFAGVLMALATATRISAVVAIGAVALCLVVPRIPAARVAVVPLPARVRAMGTFLAGAVLTLGVLYVPLFLAAPAAVRFALFEYHAGRSAGGALAGLAYKAGFISRTIGAYYPAVALFAIALLYRVIGVRSTGTNPAPLPKGAYPGGRVFPALWLSVLGVTGAHLVAPFPYDDYQALIYPLFASATAAFLACLACGEGASAAAASGSTRAWRLRWWMEMGVLVMCVAAAFSSPINQAWFIGKRDRIWWPMKQSTPLATLRNTAILVRSLPGVEAGDELLTQDPYLAVEADLRLPRGLELGQFSYFPDWSTERARRCHVLNRETFRHLLATSEAPVAAFSGYGLSIRAPEVRELPEAEQRELWAIVEARYRPVRDVEPFGQADTRLRILVRRDL